MMAHIEQEEERKRDPQKRKILCQKQTVEATLPPTISIPQRFISFNGKY
jgi:hypothetical protein